MTIAYAEETLELDNFLADIGEKPEPKAEYSIDRWPDIDGGYDKWNCAWADRNVQNEHKRPRAL